MKNLIQWLKNMEHTMGEIYSQTVEFCAHDPELKQFLQALAEDEAWHYHAMASAEKHWGTEAPKPVITMDPETNQRIITLQEALKDHIRNKYIDQETFVEKFVELELTEWNDIFLHVVNYLKQSHKEFVYPAIRIQSHLKEIERFLENRPGGLEKLAKIKQVPAIWTENILIVDDQDIISQILKALLNRDGNVQVASNGREALKLIQQSFFKLIISDIDMPIMDGLSLYRQAVDLYPSLKKRFFFISGFISGDKLKCIQENGLPYMTKPMEISLFRQRCLEILLEP
jgi:CheY-like chemotaxis protein